MERRGLRVSMDKIKMMVSGKKIEETIKLKDTLAVYAAVELWLI